MLKYIHLIIAGISLTTLGSIANAAVDYGYTYSPSFPSEVTLDGLPYAIPCAKAKNQYGAEFYRCTWKILPRLISVYDTSQQRNVTYSNQLSGQCRNGKCLAQGYDGVFGLIDKEMAFTVSRNYYIYSSADGLPIAYRLDGGPYKKGKSVTYAKSRELLAEFLLDHGQIESIVKSDIAAYNLDTATNDTVQVQGQVLTASCNPQADDDCRVNNKKVAIADLGKYLKKVNVEDVEHAGGYCEYPICYDAKDKPVGIR